MRPTACCSCLALTTKISMRPANRIHFSARVPQERIPYADTYWPTNRGGDRLSLETGAILWINPYLVDMAIHHMISLPSPAEQRSMDKKRFDRFCGSSRGMTPAPEKLHCSKTRTHRCTIPLFSARASAGDVPRSAGPSLLPPKKYDYRAPEITATR